jgi:hypothetical protein
VSAGLQGSSSTQQDEPGNFDQEKVGIIRVYRGGKKVN